MPTLSGAQGARLSQIPGISKSGGVLIWKSPFPGKHHLLVVHVVPRCIGNPIFLADCNGFAVFVHNHCLLVLPTWKASHDPLAAKPFGGYQSWVVQICLTDPKTSIKANMLIWKNRVMRHWFSTLQKEQNYEFLGLLHSCNIKAPMRCQGSDITA